MYFARVFLSKEISISDLLNAPTASNFLPEFLLDVKDLLRSKSCTDTKKNIILKPTHYSLISKSLKIIEQKKNNNSKRFQIGTTESEPQ